MGVLLIIFPLQKTRLGTPIGLGRPNHEPPSSSLPATLSPSPATAADHTEHPSEDPTPDGRGLLVTANGGREMVSYLSVLMYGVGGIVVAGNSLLVAFQEKLVYVLITSSDGVSLRACFIKFFPDGSSSPHETIVGLLRACCSLSRDQPPARPLGLLVREGPQCRGNLFWRLLAIYSFDH